MGIDEDILEAQRKKKAEQAALPKTSEDWSRGPVAKDIYEADRNASQLNGRDWDGYRHRGIYVPGGELPFEGSLQDAQNELNTVHLSQGDYLDFGPEQVGGKRFKKWKSVTHDQQADRGRVVRIALLCGFIRTSQELKIPSFNDQASLDDEFREMTSDQMDEYIAKQRAAAQGTPQAGASGDEVRDMQPPNFGGIKG